MPKGQKIWSLDNTFNKEKEPCKQMGIKENGTVPTVSAFSNPLIAKWVFATRSCLPYYEVIP